MLGVVMTGSRTMKIIIPDETTQAMRTGQVTKPLEYYDGCICLFLKTKKPWRSLTKAFCFLIIMSGK
jgi:hypothetical protein